MNDHLNPKLKVPLKAGAERDCKIRSGFRIFANDTATGRPWCWYAPDIDTAKLLAKTLCEQTGQEVEICEYIGCVRRATPPTEFIPKKT